MALLLVFDPAGTWDRIVIDERKWSGLLLRYLLPLLLLVSLVEGGGLMRWGKLPAGFTRAVALPFSEAACFEAVQVILSLIVAFAGAFLVKSLGDTFHSRHSFTQAFTFAVYGLSPVFVLRMFNAFQGISPWISFTPWVSWIAGILLSFWILYRGLPRVIKPAPSHAFGLFLTSALVLAMLSGLARLISSSCLHHTCAPLESLISRFIS